MLKMLVLFLFLLMLLESTEKHYKPVLTPVQGGHTVMIKAMLMDNNCGKMETAFLCSERPLSDLKPVARAICKSVMDTTYHTGIPVRHELIDKDIIPRGYDFNCTGQENNIDQCGAVSVHCERLVVVECQKHGIQGICNSPCGCMAPFLLSKIVGGQDAKLGEFPWQVTVTNGKYMCGGSIVDSRHIVTAAHCLHSPTRFTVPCKAQPGKSKTLPECRWFSSGYKIFYDTIDFYKRTRAQLKVTFAEYVFIHPKYIRDRYRLHHDIAVIRLAKPLEMSAYVHPVCLPDHWREFTIPLNSKLTVSGFGDTSKRRQGVYPSVLQKATMDWEDISSCNKTMYNLMKNEHFCAGDLTGAKDACQGDSGGPLIYKNDDQVATLVGVVSFSYGCALKGLWSVYTDVVKELGFVRAVMNGNIDNNTVKKKCTKYGCKIISDDLS